MFKKILMKVKSLFLSGMSEYASSNALQFEQLFSQRDNSQSSRDGAVLVLADRIEYFAYVKRSYISRRLSKKTIFHVCVNGFFEGINWSKLSSFIRINPIIIRLRFIFWRKLNRKFFGECLYNASLESLTYRILHLLSAYKEAKLFLSSSEKLSYRYRGIKIGDLVQDSYLRFTYRLNIKKLDLPLLIIFIFVVSDFKKYEKIFKSNRFDVILTSYSTYIDYGVPVRLAIHHGVDVISFGNLFQTTKLLRAEDSYHSINYQSASSDTHSDWDRFSFSKEELEKRLVLGESNLFYMKESKRHNLNVSISLENSIVVYMHDFFDSQNMYPNFIFENFYSWIIETIDYCSSKNIKVYLKPHPNQMPESVVAVDKIMQKYGPDIFLDERVSLRSVIESKCAAIVSCYGSVLFESAYFGLMPICVSKCAPSVRGIAVYRDNKQSYFDLLYNLSHGYQDFRKICPSRSQVIKDYSQLYLPASQSQFNELIILREIWALFKNKRNCKLIYDHFEKVYWV